MTAGVLARVYGFLDSDSATIDTTTIGVRYLAMGDRAPIAGSSRKRNRPS